MSPGNSEPTAVPRTESMIHHSFTVDHSCLQAFNCDWASRGYSTFSALWPGTRQFSLRREGTMSERRTR